MVSCLMFREDCITELSSCRSVQLMPISQKKKTNPEESYRVRYGDLVSGSTSLLGGTDNALLSELFRVRSLCWHVRSGTVQHAMALLGRQEEAQGHPVRQSDYTGQTKQRFGYEGTHTTACHSV
jgi:hypothetical protein